MNAKEQKAHKTAVEALRADTETVLGGLAKEVKQLLADEGAHTTKAVGDERSARLKLADEQRAYVDAEDARLRRETLYATLVLRSGFLDRVRWLLFGTWPEVKL